MRDVCFCAVAEPEIVFVDVRVRCVMVDEASLMVVLRWYAHQVDAGLPDGLMTDDFVYSDGGRTLDADDFMGLRSRSSGFEDLVVLDIFVAAARAAIMFEGLSRDDGEYYRKCWLVTLNGQKIQRIRACSQQQFYPGNKPVWIHC